MNLPKREELLFRTVHASADMAVSWWADGKDTHRPGGAHFVTEQFKDYTPKNIKMALKKGDFKRIHKEIYSRPTIMFEGQNVSFQGEYLKQAKIPLKPWLWCEKEYLKDTQFCP